MSNLADHSFGEASNAQKYDVLNVESQLHAIQLQQQRLECNKAHNKSTGQKRTRLTANGTRRCAITANIHESEKSHSLYQLGSCYWPFCETPCTTSDIFIRHLATAHLLNDKSRVECRVQHQIVEGLERQLFREKRRLRLMIKHLQQIQASKASTSSTAGNVTRKDDFCRTDECTTAANSSIITSTSADFCPFVVPPFSTESANPVQEGNDSYLLINVKQEPADDFIKPSSSDPELHDHNMTTVYTSLTASEKPEQVFESQVGAMDCTDVPSLDCYSLYQIPTEDVLMRADPDAVDNDMSPNNHGEKTTNNATAAVDASAVKVKFCGFMVKPDTATATEIAEDLRRNRELYKTVKKRPPFIYAALIRQAIWESPDWRLTLREIYKWFEDNFAYFREISDKNSSVAWKNSIRHTLSHSKCFNRVETEIYFRDGAYWTVDDTLFDIRHPMARLNLPSCHDINTERQTTSESSVESVSLIESSPLSASSQQTAVAEALRNEHLLRPPSEPGLKVCVKEQPEDEESFYGFSENEFGVSPSTITSLANDYSNVTPDSDSDSIQCLVDQEGEETYGSYEDYKLNIWNS